MTVNVGQIKSRAFAITAIPFETLVTNLVRC